MQPSSESRASQGHAALPLVVYSPESGLKRPRQLLTDMVHDLWLGRELAWRLFVRDMRAQYRQSMLGYFWLLAPPIASTLLFVFLQSQRILNVSATEVPYPLFVLIGMVLWESFTAALLAPINAVTAAASMLSKLNFPREAILLAAVYQVLFSLAIKLLLLVPVYLWVGVVPTWKVALLPLGLGALLGFGFMLGVLLVPLGLLYQDVARTLTMLMGFWMLVTPVIYPPPTSWPASLLNYLNPATPLVVTTREMLTSGTLTAWPAALGIGLASGVLLLAGWVLYRLAMPHLVSRMSA